APFMLTTVAPILLEGVEPKAETLPGRGRQLLSFTDSRQGTARMAAKLQMEAERNFVRSFIYHQVQASRTYQSGSSDEIEELKRRIAALEAACGADPDPVIQGMIEDYKHQLQLANGGDANGIAWPDLVNRLA